MKLSLTNFRCHRDRTFEIPENGLVLLSGKSGAGKSTVLNALMYVLYGKLQKPYSHGEKTCTVKLEHKGAVITRTKSSSVKVVYDETEWEGEGAQAVIDDLMGMTYDEFMSSSYVVQSLRNSVISLTSSNQAKFLEKIAFSDDLHIEYKKRIANEVARIKESTAILKGSVDSLKENVEVLENDMMDEPPKVDLEKLKNDSDDLNIKQQNLIDEIASTEKYLAEIKKSEEIHRAARVEREKIEVLISSSELTLSQVNPPSGEKVEEMKTLLADLQGELFISQSQRELKELQQKKVELENSTPEQSQLPENLEQIYALHSFLTSHKFTQNPVHELTRLKKECMKYAKISGRTKNPKIIRKKAKDAIIAAERVIRNNPVEQNIEGVSDVMKCPGCGISTYVSEGKLHEAKGDVDTLQKVAEAKQAVEFLEKAVKIFDVIVEVYEMKGDEILKEYDEFIDFDRAVQEYKRTETTDSSAILSSLLKGVERDIAVKISAIGDNPTERTEAEISQEIVETEEEMEGLLERYSQASILRRELKRNKRKLDELSAPLVSSYPPSFEIEERLQSLRSDRESLVEDQAAIEVQRREALRQEEYIRSVERLRLAKEKYESANSKYTEELKRYEGAVGLASAAKEAEILSMQQTIGSINEHAKVYLEELFEDPIVVRLDGYKINSKGVVRSQVNTVVEYKGNVYGSLNELSGGEVQRCELAFLLAVNDMIGSNVLLLDECLNNLDAEINLDTLDFLKEMSSDKLILVVSHEAVNGVFDHTISV